LIFSPHNLLITLGIIHSETFLKRLLNSSTAKSMKTSSLLASISVSAATCILGTLTTHAVENEFLGSNAGGTGQGDRNVAIGDEAGANMTTVDESVVMGAHAGYLLHSDSPTLPGFNSGQIFIGFRAAGHYTQAEWDAFQADPVNDPLPNLHRDGDTPYVPGTTHPINNTFIGYQAGLRNYLGSDGTFVGYKAGQSNTIGHDNTFIGQEAGRDNEKGTDNTFVGEDSGRNNIDGNDNTAVGSRSLTINQIGRYNTAIGSDAGQEIGRHGFTLAHERAVRNTCIGQSAGYDIGVGNCNTMLGDNAGPNTEHSHFNTFVGQNAGFDNNRSNNLDDANRNTALGAFSGYSNRTGEDNVWIGMFADSGQWLSSYDHDLLLLDMKVGPSWDPVPCFAPTGTSQAVSRTLVLGSFASARDDDSIALGYNSRTTGANTITIGNGSQALGAGDIAIGTSASSNHAGAITIGNSATSHGDNLAVIGSASTVGWHPGADGVTALGSSTYRFSSATAETFSAEADASGNAVVSFVADAGTANDDRWKLEAENGGNFNLASFASGSYTTILTATNTGDVTVTGDMNVNSDERLKKDITPINNAIGLVSQLEGKTYHWKSDLGRSDRLKYGLLAQEVEEVIPEVVSTNKKDGIKSVNYQALVPVLINAVNQQQDEISLLKEQLAVQQALLKKLTATNDSH